MSFKYEKRKQSPGFARLCGKAGLVDIKICESRNFEQFFMYLENDHPNTVSLESILTNFTGHNLLLNENLYEIFYASRKIIL
jgi:hypothetical protein